MVILPTHACTPHVCLVPRKAWDWSSRQLYANTWVLESEPGSSGKPTLRCIHLLVSDVTRVMDPDEFVEPLVATGAQLQAHMEAMICLLDRNTAEIPVFMVKWLL